jgi:hypothetical protein
MNQSHKCLSHINRKKKLKNNPLSFIEYETLINRAAPELRRLVTELVPWRHGFDPRPVHERPGGGGRQRGTGIGFPPSASAFPDSITTRRSS